MKIKKKKQILNASIIITMILSAISVFAVPVISDEYEHQADWDNDATIWMELDGDTNGKVELGDDFDVTIYIDAGENSFNVWAFRNITHNEPVAFRVNVTPPGASEPNRNVSFLGVWNVAEYAGATLGNDTGVLSEIGSYYASGTSGNSSVCLINFTTMNVGQVWINQSFNNSDLQTYVRMGADDFTISFQNNISLLVTPQDPASFTATTYNHTAINLSWVKGAGDDNVTICRSDVSYDDISGPEDGQIYNGSNLTYNDTGLTNCTQYFYKIWGFNATAGLHSATYRQATATTECYTNFTITGANPAHDSTTANCTYSILVNVTVLNTEVASFNYWINASNGQTHSANTVSLPTNIGFTLTNLDHNTLYWWNVTVTDGLGDSTNASYNFTTGVGGGTAPVGGAIVPTSASTSNSITFDTLSIGVTDADGDPINVTFYWGNDTVIGYDDTTPSGGTASINPGCTLNYSTRYFWHAVLNDTCETTRCPVGNAEYFFNTDEKNISVSKTMHVHANNSIEVWINMSNEGEVNLTDVWVNETYDSDTIFVDASPANETGDNTSWVIPFLNMTGYDEHWVNITIWLNVSWPLANGSTITNSITVEDEQYTTGKTATPLTVCFYAVKTANINYLWWNTTAVNFTINVTNCGDFYLDWVQINETYDANYTFVSSNIVGNTTNETFNITVINPGDTATLLINVSTTFGGGGDPFVNASYHYNNITINSNQTNPEIEESSYLVTGAQTESIRITYVAVVTDVGGIGDSIVAILGALFIIGAILLIIVVVRKGGMLGGGG